MLWIILLGLTFATTIHVNASQAQQDALIALYVDTNHLSCPGTIYKNDNPLPTQAVDCINPGLILFQADLDAGDNLFTYYPGDDNPFLEVVSNQTYELPVEITLPTPSSDDIYVEMVVGLEDFFYPGNEIELLLGGSNVITAEVLPEGGLSINGKIVETTPGPLYIIVNSTHYGVGPLGEITWVSHTGSPDQPIIRFNGQGKVWIKRLWSGENVNLDAYVEYESPPSLPVEIESEGGIYTIPFVIEKERFRLLGWNAPYYTLSDNPTVYYCEGELCYGVSEVNLQAGTNILYLKPAYSLTPPSKAVLNTSCETPALFGHDLEDFMLWVKYPTYTSISYPQLYSDYYYLSRDIAPSIPGYWERYNFSYIYTNSTHALYSLNNHLMLWLGDPEVNYSLRPTYYSIEQAICMEDPAITYVLTFPVQEIMVFHYGATGDNATSFVYPYILHERYLDCNPCIFSDKVLANANITSTQITLDNVTFYGWINAQADIISVNGVRGYGYGSTLLEGRGPGKGIPYPPYETGGSHAGMGGRNSYRLPHVPEGDLTTPGMGSGGSGDGILAGGIGGGMLLLEGTQVSVSNVDLSGQPSVRGAGAGGSLYVQASSLLAQNISVAGGSGKAGGGGGKISLIGDSISVDNWNISGGAGSDLIGTGGSGILYVSNGSGNYVWLDNGGNPTLAPTYISQPINGELWILNGARAEQNTTYLNLTNLYILNNSVLSYRGYPWKTILNISYENLYLDESSRIEALYKGVYRNWDILDEYVVDLSPKPKQPISWTNFPQAGTIYLQGNSALINGSVVADIGVDKWGYLVGTAGKIFIYGDLEGTGNISANELDGCEYNFYSQSAEMGYIELTDSFPNVYYYPLESCVADVEEGIIGWGGFHLNETYHFLGDGGKDMILDNISGTYLLIGYDLVHSVPEEATQIAIGDNVSFSHIYITNGTLYTLEQVRLEGTSLSITETGRLWAIGSVGEKNEISAGVICGAGPYPVCSTNDYTTGINTGASHGGTGTIAMSSDHEFNEKYYPFPYGDFRWPTLPGSTPPCYSARAGGALLLQFERIENNGTISATAENGASGGSLLLIGNITNNGVIEANGGNSYTYCRALGGGGRIAIYYDSFVPGTITAYGGEDINGYLSGIEHAAPGTIYLQNLTDNSSELYIIGRGKEYHEINTSMAQLPSFYEGKIIVENATVGAWNSSQFLNELYLINSTLTHPPYPASLNHYINLTAQLISLEQESNINVTAMGYGPNYDDPPLGPGGGAYRAGGGYGGKGGDYYSSPGGLPYGVLTNPIYLGSSGGNYSSGWDPGGAGGGRILLYLEEARFGDFTYIQADGQVADSYAGGGSGGSILLMAKNISGNIHLSARGGSTDWGGSGGGGRIALYLAYNESFNYDYDVSQGRSGYTSREGDPGTFYLGNFYYLEPISLPTGPFEIGDSVSLEVDFLLWNGTEFESYDQASVWLLHNEELSYDPATGEILPAILNFTYSTTYQAQLTFTTAGPKNYLLQGLYQDNYPIVSLPWNIEVYGWYINLTKDKPYYFPDDMAMVQVEAFYYPTNQSYEGNMSFYYKGELLESTFINRTYLLIFNVGNEAGFHELVAHID